MSQDGVLLVIVTHDRPELLRRTLDSVAQCIQSGFRVRTIVVENGMRETAEQVVRSAASHLDCEYLFIPSPRKSDALNGALAKCEDELVVFLDDDVRVAPRLLQVYADARAEFGRGHYFGGPTGVDYEVAPPEWLKPFLPPSAVGLGLGQDQRVVYPTCFLGFNWAAFASDLHACGGFSSSFGPGTISGAGDESFMQWRLNRRGVVGRYLAEAIVWHYVPADRCSSLWAVRRARGGGFNAGIFAEQWHRQNRKPLRKIRLVLGQLKHKTQRGDLRRLILLRQDGRLWARSALAWLISYWRGMGYGSQRRPLDDEMWRVARFQ